MIVDSIEESVTDAEKDGAPKKFAITDYKFFELLKPRRPKPILHRILIRHLSSLAVDHPDIEIQAKKEAETRKQETDKELAETAIRRREARRLLSGIKVLRRPPVFKDLRRVLSRKSYSTHLSLTQTKLTGNVFQWKNTSTTSHF